jgi:type IV pilus assembly protein PilF
MHSARRLILLLLVVTSAALTGCITTQEGGIGDKKDAERALDYSLQAARSYIAQQNWESAKRHLRNALAMDDRNAEVHEALALVFQNTGEYELAGDHFRRAVSLDGKASRIRNNYAVFLYQRRDYAGAEQQLERVVADVMYDRREAAFVNLGLARMRLTKYEAAKEAFERAFMMDKQSLVTTFQLAEVYYRVGEFERSQQFYEIWRGRVQRQSPAGLWLGIRLADRFGDRNAQASYALALKNMYPRSEEYLEYVSVYGDGSNR